MTPSPSAGRQALALEAGGLRLALPCPQPDSDLGKLLPSPPLLLGSALPAVKGLHLMIFKIPPSSNNLGLCLVWPHSPSVHPALLKGRAGHGDSPTEPPSVCCPLRCKGSCPGTPLRILCGALEEVQKPGPSLGDAVF